MNYKLSDILRAQEILSSIDKEQLSVNLNSDIKEFVEIIEKFNLVDNSDLHNKYHELNSTILYANRLIERLVDILETFENNLSNERKISHQDTLKSTNDIFSYHLVWEKEEEYLWHREQWKVTPAIIDETVSLIGKYINWKYPVVYYEPHTANLLQYLRSGDPFYIVDDMELPYKNILETVPRETAGKLYHYTKSQAQDFLEKDSVGMCVSWQNIPFKKLGEVRKDIELMSAITKPGGYVIFDYVDAGVSSVAKEIEDGKFMFQWRDRILQFLDENNLEILHEVDFIDYSANLLVCQKQGKTPELNISNKLGLVLPDSKSLDRKREEELAENKRLKAARSKIEQDLKRLQERDQLLKDLDKHRSEGKENVIESKLHNAINHLNSMIAAYDDYTHPSVLEALLHVSKLTYNLGRVKDSKNLIKRVERDIAKMSADNFIARKYREWQDFLNNIDT
jgi:DNA-directed RNA polymerase subunit F